MHLFSDSSCQNRRRAPRRWALLWLLSGWLLAPTAHATHIVGGELELVHRNAESYTLVLNLYFDAVNGDVSLIDASLTASIFDKATNNRMQNVALPLVSNTLVNYSNPACTRPTLITRKLIYSKDLELPAGAYQGPQGYYVAIERCCRNLSIANITNPGNAAQTFYLEFPAVRRNGQPFYNSSPRLLPAPAEYACLGELFTYDFGGYDPDGDSLAYELVTPLNGHASLGMPKPTAAPLPYAPISWVPGLSAANAIPGLPTLTIDKQGRLAVRPTDAGLYAFGVRCSEYRRREKIGEVRRDFQLQVITCPLNRTPALTVLTGRLATVPYQTRHDTLHFVPGSNHCVRVRFTDPDANSRLTLSLNPVNFGGKLPVLSGRVTGLVRAAGAPDTLTATLCFPDCLDSQNRVWLLDVTVADDGCSQPRRKTTRLAFTAVPTPNSPPAVTTTAPAAHPLPVRVGGVVSFDVVGSDPDNDTIRLEMNGRGFAPAALGATFTPVPGSFPPRARFNWPVDCRALVSDSVRVFEFTVVTQPCVGRQVATVAVPIVVRYANQAPVLVAGAPLPPAAAGQPPLVRLPLGTPYTISFVGTDADQDGLTLTASSENFTLAEASMRFDARNGSGSATGTFEWTADCQAAALKVPLDVTFQLLDATCRPLPQRQTIRFAVERPASPELKLYNIITPNGDGLNDTFSLPGLPLDFCAEQFAHVRVFSRWGQQVFESTDRQFHWAGQGMVGLYYYLVSYTDGRHFKGWLEVKP